MDNDSREEKEIVRLSGSLVIRTVTEIQRSLLTALEKATPLVEVDCANATEVDVSFIQTMIAARRSASARGLSIALAAPASGVLLQALRSGGFLSADGTPSSPDGAFWTGERRVP